MGLFNRKAKEVRQFFPYTSNIYTGTGLFSAELNPTVDTCVSLIANTVAQLPINLKVHTKSGAITLYSHPVARVLKDPAVEETSLLFYKTMTRHILLNGGAFIFKHKSNNEVVCLELIDPARVTVRRDRIGRREYTISGDRGGVFTDAEIIYIPYTGEGYNGTLGKSPVLIHKDLIKTNDLLDEYIRLYFTNGIGSRLLVELGEKYEPGSPKVAKLVQEFGQYFQEFVLGSENAGRPVITPPGSKITKIEQSSNVQTDILNLKKESDSSISRIFNIPAEVIFSHENKYGSLESRYQDFLLNCIKPLCLQICQALAKGLLKPSDMSTMFIEYDYRALLETDLSKKIDFYVKGFNNGLFNLNEVREAFSLGSLENEVEGSTRVVPSSVIPWTQSNIESILAKSKLALSELEDKTVNHNGEMQDKLI